MSTLPPLVLHVCCAPDEAGVVHTLHGRYDLTCFFCNPNIAPEEEYRRRASEAKQVAAHFRVRFAEDEYLPDSWEEAIADATMTHEGGERCRRCFMLRFRRTAAFCRAQLLPAFTTVMSVSPHKSVGLLNECGTAVAAEWRLTWEPFDFKKQDGFRTSILLSRELGLYRQDYCGCRLSKEERDWRKAFSPPPHP